MGGGGGDEISFKCSHTDIGPGKHLECMNTRNDRTLSLFISARASFNLRRAPDRFMPWCDLSCRTGPQKTAKNIDEGIRF